LGVALKLSACWGITSACTPASTQLPGDECALSSGIPDNFYLVNLQFSCGAPPTDAHVTGPCVLSRTNPASYAIQGIGSGSCTFEATGPGGKSLVAPIAFEGVPSGPDGVDCGLQYAPTVCPIVVSGLPACGERAESLCVCSACGLDGCSDIVCADAGTMGD
jgi:hypothetical protein